MESFWIQVALGALKSFSFVYDVITFPIYLLLQRPWKRRVMSRRIKVGSFLSRFIFAQVIFAKRLKSRLRAEFVVTTEFWFCPDNR